MPRKPTQPLQKEQPRVSFLMSNFVTINEAAEELGIKPRTLRERLRRRGVPVTKVGYGSLISRSDLARLM